MAIIPMSIYIANVFAYHSIQRETQIYTKKPVNYIHIILVER